MGRKGVTPAGAKTVMRTNATVIGSMLLKKGEGDALLCGTVGHYQFHLRHVKNVIGLREGVTNPAAMVLLMLPKWNVFLTDTHVNPDPSPEEIADMTILAARGIQQFGIAPKAALLSHSNFGSHNTPSAIKMREAAKILSRRAPELEFEGEMHGDAALSPTIRDVIFPQAKLEGVANLLVMPNMDAANISFNLLKSAHDAITVGPILLGMNQPVHILHPAIRARGIVNITALAAAEVQATQDGLLVEESLPLGP
jgi:malate dehydrogenase (oxaloacetate-decarboxylating)(NADP+)